MALFAGIKFDDEIYDIIVAAACRHNQPAGLALWLARFESSFNPQAVSWYQQCCKGLYQFKNVGTTNGQGGLGSGYTDEQLFDPAFNAELAMAYMENNGGMESILANVNPWESGPIALAAWNADLRWNPPCPGTVEPGTVDPGTTTPGGSSPGSGPPTAYPSTGTPNVGADAGGIPNVGAGTPSGNGGFDWAGAFKSLGGLPGLIKLGFANAVVLTVAGVLAVTGVYLVVTATAGINEKDITKAGIAAVKVAA